MALIAYCTAADLEQLLSEYGVNVRSGDGFSGTGDSSRVTKSIEKAVTDVNAALYGRYSQLVIAASAWAKWCTAHLAAEALCRRRGNPIPEPLVKEADRYREILAEIKIGISNLMADDGLATPTNDATPSVSNMAVDGSFLRGKVRRVQATSTGGPPGPGLQRHDDRNFNLP